MKSERRGTENFGKILRCVALVAILALLTSCAGGKGKTSTDTIKFSADSEHIFMESTESGLSFNDLLILFTDKYGEAYEVFSNGKVPAEAWTLSGDDVYKAEDLAFLAKGRLFPGQNKAEAVPIILPQTGLSLAELESTYFGSSVYPADEAPYKTLLYGDGSGSGIKVSGFFSELPFQIAKIEYAEAENGEKTLSAIMLEFVFTGTEEAPERWAIIRDAITNQLGKAEDISGNPYIDYSASEMKELSIPEEERPFYLSAGWVTGNDKLLLRCLIADDPHPRVRLWLQRII